MSSNFMSLNKSSMPSINESYNEEDTDKGSNNEEEISTSDYSSLKREKNATLTKIINDFMSDAEADELKDKVATLKATSNGNDDYHVDDNRSAESEDSKLSLHDESETVPPSEEVMNQITADAVKSYQESSVSSEMQPDRFGFYKGSHYTDPDSDLNLPISVLRNRERKWQHMLMHWNEYGGTGKRNRKLMARCRKGVPQSLRSRVWQLLCGSNPLSETVDEQTMYRNQVNTAKESKLKRNILGGGSGKFFKSSRTSLRASSAQVSTHSGGYYGGGPTSLGSARGGSIVTTGSSNCSDADSVSVISCYSAAVQIGGGTGSNVLLSTQKVDDNYHALYIHYQKIRPNVDVVDQIRKDIHRQFPDHESFTSRGGMGQESLATLLTVYSVRHPETGYCQGMAPLAAALLMVMPEEDAFWTFDKVCDSYIPGYYDEGLKQIQIDAKALNALLKKESSNVYNILKKQQIDTVCFMIDWFMCIFIRTLPWPSVLLVLDMFLCEGKSVLFKVGIVLIIAVVSKTMTMPGASAANGDGCLADELLTSLRHLPPEITTPKFLTSHISRLGVSKSDIKKECETQLKLMDKARIKAKR